MSMAPSSADKFSPVKSESRQYVCATVISVGSEEMLTSHARAVGINRINRSKNAFRLRGIFKISKGNIK